MKLILTLPFLLVLPAVTNAQISIDQGEMPYAGDELWRTQAVVNPFMNYGATGANHTWNFANLAAAGQDSADYLSVASTNFIYAIAYADIFFNPNRANHAIAGVDIPFNQLLPITDPYTFYYRSASVYKKVGYGVGLAGLPVPITYTQHDVIYNLPLNYGDGDVSNSAYELSIPTLAYYGYQQERTNEVDGWGSITTPTGTFDVLRVKTTLAGRDTINIDTLSLGFSIERPLVHQYKWLAENLRVPVLQVNTTEIFGLEVITEVYFYDLPRSITVAPPLASTLCPGSTVAVNYTVTGVFNVGSWLASANDFTVQLSDANGDFTNAVNIGSLQYTESGTISVTIPANTPAGTGYRIRVVADSPAFTGEDNGFDITIDGTVPDAIASALGTTEFCAGGSVMLEVTTQLGQTIQWQLDGVDIAGANNATQEALASGDYTAVVSNGCGSDVSAAITVTVNEIPEHLLSQSSYITCDGSPLNLTTQNTTGQTSLTYQWYMNGLPVTGANSQDLVTSDAGTYYLEVENTQTGCSYTTASATVATEFVAAPGVVASGNTTFCQGSSVTLDAVALAGLTYQWYLDGLAISGAVDTTLLVGVAGDYTVVATGPNGCVSTPSLATTVAVEDAPDAPVITPSSATSFCEGGAVTLDAGVIPGVTYQWSVDGIDIPGANSSALVVTTSGSYTVVVTSNGGCASTAVTAIDVTANPLPDAPVITQSADTLYASGTGSFQWTYFGNPIVGATDGFLVVTGSGDYAVMITDANGCSSTSLPFSYISTGVLSANSNGFSIYPNPNNGEFVIQLPGQTTGLFEVTDAAGKRVLAGSLTGTTDVDLRSSEGGLYLVRIVIGGVVSTERIVVY